MALDTTAEWPARAALSSRILALARPRMLARAAARVARHYRRGRDLAGALPGQGGLGARDIAERLLALEARLEEARREGTPGYRAGRHVQVLGALIAEARAG